MALVCRVCGHGKAQKQTLICKAKRFAGRQLEVESCEGCGFTYAPQNRHEYENKASFGPGSRVGGSARVGDGTRPGREYRMLETAMEILDRAALEVAFYGPGESRDHKLARQHKNVASSHITDLQNYQESVHYRPLEENHKYDVVICCEVAEHFEQPREDFERLLGMVKRDGLAVCSTNIHDGGNIEKTLYLFIPGHVSYYTGEALIEIARQNGFMCDFRVPQCALGAPGPRKRYIYFYRDNDVQVGLSRFFSRVPFAYSEKA